MSLQHSIKRIWLIGGTRESAELATELIRSQIPCVVSVTTESARSLYPFSDNAYLQIWVGRLQTETIGQFIQTYRIGAILDASHPFATEVSQLAIATANQLQLPYLRFERPTLNDPSLQKLSVPTPSNSLETVFSCIDTFLDSNELVEQRALLTIGYRFLPLFQPWQEKATLFVRILPSIVALEAALEAGFSSDRIIALRPPVSVDLERALWQHWQISMVVTKASGTPGGEAMKRQLAAELGIKLVLISRPDITYPGQTSDVSEALKFCQRFLG